MKKLFFFTIFAGLMAFTAYSQTVVTQFDRGTSAHLLGGVSLNGVSTFAGVSYVNRSNVLFSFQGKGEYLIDQGTFTPNGAFTVGYVHNNKRPKDFCYARRFKLYNIPTFTVGFGRFLENSRITRTGEAEKEAEEVLYNAPYFALGYNFGISEKTYKVGLTANVSVLHRKAAFFTNNYTGLHTIIGVGAQGSYKLTRNLWLQGLVYYDFYRTLGFGNNVSFNVGISYTIK